MTLYKLLSILLFALVARGAMGVALSRLGPEANYYLEELIQVTFYLFLLVFCIRYFQISKPRLNQVFGKPKMKDVITGILVGISMLGLALGESALVTYVFAQVEPAAAYEMGKFHPVPYKAHPIWSAQVLLFAISGVLAPAVVEEFFFRGLLLEALQLKHSFVKSAVSCSLIFTVLHFNEAIYINSFLFSLISCYCYGLSRSLYPCIAIHATFNLVTFLNQYYFDFHRTRSQEQLTRIWEWQLEILLFLASIVILASLFKHHGQARWPKKFRPLSCSE